MSAEVFLDSNVCVYLFDKDGRKKSIAMDLLLGRKVVVSTQVLMETANVARRKLGLDSSQIHKAVDFICSLSAVQPITKLHVEQAMTIHAKYGFSLYDSLIVAAAILSNCPLLYSEDMQHNQQIEGKLTIVNPFIL